MLGKAVGYATRVDMVLPMQRLNHRDSGKPTASGDPAAEPEQLEQVVAGADEQPFPVDLRQAPQQELPETPHMLDLAEHRFHRLHPQGVTLPAPLGL